MSTFVTLYRGLITSLHSFITLLLRPIKVINHS
jgi:hypothetical protein